MDRLFATVQPKQTLHALVWLAIGPTLVTGVAVEFALHERAQELDRDLLRERDRQRIGIVGLGIVGMTELDAQCAAQSVRVPPLLTTV